MSTNGRPQQTNQQFVDHERSEQVRILRLGHQVEQARHRLDDAVGRAPDVEPAIVRRRGNAIRVHAHGEFCHTCGGHLMLGQQKKGRDELARFFAERRDRRAGRVAS